MRVQLLKVLDQAGASYLEDTAALKYIIAPILVKNTDQQQLFYDLFDSYCEDIKLPLDQAAPEKNWHEKIPPWGWFAFLTCLLSLLVYLVYTNLPEPEPIIFCEHDKAVKIGDTLHFKNMCEGVGPLDLKWEISNEQGIIEQDTILKKDWHLPITKEMGQVFNKKLKLTLIDDLREKEMSYESEFVVHCENKPVGEKINWPDSVHVGDYIVLKDLQTDDRPYVFKWMLDDKKVEGNPKEFRTVFTKEGIHDIVLMLSLPDEDGFCQHQIKHNLTVFDNKKIVPLVQKNLEAEVLKAETNFKKRWWLFLGLLSLIPFWFWYKWWKNQQAEKDLDENQAAKNLNQSTDEAPYFIPFRPMDHVIKAGKELYQFANTLRIRQEGLRKELNVSKSLKATIEKGGFPEIKMDRSTQPSEYLFLIDDQHNESVQSRLFEYLVDFLRDKDVLVDCYFYKDEPYSLWKKKPEEALNLTQLQRIYPYHRLVILGDARRFLDPHSADVNQLKKEYVYPLQRWKNRVLLTPFPACSWTFEEAALHNYFAIYPSDMRGINDAFDRLQESMEEEDANTPFTKWQLEQSKLREEIDVKYRKWRRLSTIKDYLSTRPDLWKWFCALAVHPIISWELTLALGQALKDDGVEVNFNNLLILSRIPWLQNGHIPPKLRLQLLNELDDQTELLARQVLKDELEAVSNLVKNGFANVELQTGLAVQNFLTSPENKDYQKRIRSLMQGESPIIGKHRLKELDQKINSYQATKGKKTAGVKQFLEDATQNEVEEQKRPIFNTAFNKALIASMILLAIWMFSLSLNGSNILNQARLNSPLSIGNFLLRSHTFPPSEAARLNNEAVELSKNKDYSFVNVAVLLREALNLKPDYQLALDNDRRILYNEGVRSYYYHFDNPDSSLIRAYNSFKQVVDDENIKTNKSYWDAQHGIGLVHHYQTNRDSARRVYELIAENSTFFDTLKMTPNLSTFYQTYNYKRSARLSRILDQKISEPKYLWCLDNASGKLEKGKRSPVLEDGQQFLEYEFSRDIVRRMMLLMDCIGLQYYNVVPELEVNAFLKERTKRINDKVSNLKKLVLSIHSNAAPIDNGQWANDKWSGIETWWYQYSGNNAGKIIAEVIQDNLVTDTGWKNRGVKPNAKFYVLRNTKYPAIQTNIGFYNNKQQCEALLADTMRQRIAESLVAGIIEMENANIPPSTKEDIVKTKPEPIDTEPKPESVTIYGTIIDKETKDPLIGATVKIANSSVGTVTDIDGNFSIRHTTAKNKIDFEISYQGFKTLRTSLAKDLASSANFELSPERQNTPSVPVQDFTKGNTFSIPLDAFFGDTKNYVLSQTNRQNFEELLRNINSKPNSEIELNFHIFPTRSAVKNALNQKLADQFAKSLTNYLVKNGISKDRIVSTFLPAGETAGEESRLDIIIIEEEYNNTPAQQQGPPINETASSDRLKENLVFVKGGTFIMGGDTEGKDDRQIRQVAKKDLVKRPYNLPHEVELSDFYIDKYEVTVEQFAAFLNAYGSNTVKKGKYKGQEMLDQIIVSRDSVGVLDQYKDGTWNLVWGKGVEDVLPMIAVTWYGANEYAKFYGLELPTEAQWEYAARGGQKSKPTLYAGSNKLSEVASWGIKYEKNAALTRPVGYNNANELGIYDMSGNVMEWCKDNYQQDFYKVRTKGTPFNPECKDPNSNKYVLRGGSWNSTETACLVSKRNGQNGKNTTYYIGFRCVRPVSYGSK